MDDAGLVFTVADSGPGIAANMREEVFKEYVQGEGAQRSEGLGGWGWRSCAAWLTCWGTRCG